nr:hypothetical protein BCU43_23190 [Vibrio lentus]
MNYATKLIKGLHDSAAQWCYHKTDLYRCSMLWNEIFFHSGASGTLGIDNNGTSYVALAYNESTSDK